MSRKSWTQEELVILKREYPFVETKIIAKKLEITLQQCSYMAYKLDLKKDILFLRQQSERLRDTGKKFRFKKGQQSYNKGKKWEEYMPEESAEKIRKSHFLKGQIPHNSLPLGSEVTRKESCGKEYLLIKVKGKRTLIFKHIYIYESAFGKVEKGMCIVFKDGNTLNCNIENLECITRAELVIRNSIHRYPPELKSQIKKVNKLKRIIKKIEK